MPYKTAHVAAKWYPSTRINPHSRIHASVSLGAIAPTRGRKFCILNEFSSVPNQDPQSSSHVLTRDIEALNRAIDWNVVRDAALTVASEKMCSSNGLTPAIVRSLPSNTGLNLSTLDSSQTGRHVIAVLTRGL